MKNFLKTIKTILSVLVGISAAFIMNSIVYTAGLIDQDLITFSQSLQRLGIIALATLLTIVAHQIKTMIKYYIIEYCD